MINIFYIYGSYLQFKIDDHSFKNIMFLFYHDPILTFRVRPLFS